MMAYYGNPEATAAAFTADGFFRSGDLGYTVAEGDFVFLSRIGDVLRLSGFLVNPLEIEAVLDAHPSVASSQVVGIDGPRGPRYVAKPGPVLLARATGAPMVAFHIAVEKAWTLNTWDKVMIPKPFSRALLRISRQIVVPADANDAGRKRFHAELQAALDRVREFAERDVKQVGSTRAPLTSRKLSE